MKEEPCTLAHAIERAQSYPDGHWCRVLLEELQRLQAARGEPAVHSWVAQPVRSEVVGAPPRGFASLTAEEWSGISRAMMDLDDPMQALWRAEAYEQHAKRTHRPKGWIYPQDRAPWWRRLWAWFRKELRRPQAFPLNDPRAHP